MKQESRLVCKHIGVRVKGKVMREYYSPLRFQSGFSLLEMLLYVSLIGIIMVAVAAFLTVMLKGRVREQAIAEVEQQGAIAMATIAQNIRNAKSIASVTSNSIDVIDFYGTHHVYTTATDSSCSPNTTAFQSTDGGVSTFFTNCHVTISSVTFAQLNRLGTNGTIDITFTMEYKSNAAATQSEYNYSKVFYTTASLR